ncbi:hypothetical protein HN676_04800, partial [Candidatus Woesearchaeota archaeon]|nr:hypothetical protein [Candidatus Woesearchaeota archaeon]
MLSCSQIENQADSITIEALSWSGSISYDSNKENICNGEPGCEYYESECVIDQVRNCTQLITAIQSDENITIANNIDCSGITFSDWIGGSVIYGNNFSGQNYTISNVFIDGGANDDVGLFPQLKTESEIRDLKLNNITVTGGFSVGAIAGDISSFTQNDGFLLYNVQVTNANVTADHTVGGLFGENIINSGYSSILKYVSFSGNITSTSSSSTKTGGFVGGANRINISFSNSTGILNSINQKLGGILGYGSSDIIFNNVSSTMTIIGTYTSSIMAGGLVGDLIDSSSIINNSFFNGSIKTISSTSSTARVGGLIGLLSDASVYNSYSQSTINSTTENVGGAFGLITNSSSSVLIDQCFADGSVYGKTNVGGFVGTLVNGEVENSHTRSSVTGTGSNIGGFIGSMSSGTIINQTYSTGQTSGGSVVGGFLGTGSGTIDNSFFDNQTSGQTSSTGSGSPEATAKTTNQMETQATFTDSNWDFTNIWEMGITYPILQWFDEPSDSNPPQIFDVRPLEDSGYNISDIVNITANITDANTIDSKIINLTYPNGTIEQFTLASGTGDIFYYEFTIPNQEGEYNITYIANDTSNNINNTITTNFNVEDTQNPQVTNLIPSIGDAKSTGEVIEIRINVTDNSEIDTVRANITLPNSSSIILSLTEQSNNKFNNSYTVPELTGLFNITFLVNDTYGNQNNTESTNFTTSDTSAPSYTGINEYPNDPATYDLPQDYLFNITFTDNNQMDTVLIEFDGTNYTTNNSGDYYNFTISNLSAGTYNYKWIANDSSDNVNNTAFTYTINKATSNVNLSLNNQFSNITSEVETNVTINATKIIGENNITIYMDEELVGSNLDNITNISLFSSLGLVNISVIYNESENYTSSSLSYFITVQDTTAPSVIDIDLNPSELNPSENISINISVSEHLNVDTVIAEVILNNGTKTNLSTTYVESEDIYSTQYQTDANIPSGTHTVRAYANDTSGNMNSTENGTFIITDIANPEVTNLIPSSGDSKSIGETIEIRINATDDVQIDTVRANLTMPNSTSVIILLNEQSNNKYNNSYTIPNLSGRFNISFLVNDTSDNDNTTETTYFLTTDLIAPTYENNSEYPSDPNTYSIPQDYLFNISFTDNVEMHSVLFEFDGTNYTANNNGNDYNYTISNLSAGTYNYKWIANDTSDNINNTAFTYTVSLALSDVNLSLNNNFSNITIEAGNSVNINATKITGESNITLLINESIIQSNLNNITNISNYNSLGTFNITALYNQSQNYSTSSLSYFITVQDTTKPNVTNIIISPSTINQTQNVTINVTVQDFIGVDTVIAEINLNNGTKTNQTMSLNGNIYTTEYETNINSPIGQHTIKIYANDTSNNLNSTESATFNINDITVPQINNSIPSAGDSKSIGELIEVRINATDNIEVDTVRANLTLPNSTNIIISLTEQSNNKYNNSYTIPNLAGTFNITFLTNDTSNNQNNSITTYFTVSDLTAPSYENNSEYPNDPNTYSIPQDYLFNISFTDNVEVDNVLFEFDGTNYTPNNNGNDYNYTISNLSAGTYNYKWIANDTSDNINNTAFTYTVSRASSDVNLSLNNNFSNITIEAGDSVNINATKITGESNITFLFDEVEVRSN